MVLLLAYFLFVDVLRKRCVYVCVCVCVCVVVFKPNIACHDLRDLSIYREKITSWPAYRERNAHFRHAYARMHAVMVYTPNDPKFEASAYMSCAKP